MGFLNALRSIFGGGPPAAAPVYWIYAQCRRCGEPLRARVDLRNDVSLSDDGTSWVVTKGLLGSGARRCFQTVEVTLTFNSDKSQVLDSQVSGGTLLTAEEYEALLNQPEPPAEENE